VAHSPKLKCLARFKPRGKSKNPPRASAKLALFAKLWAGNIIDTLAACAAHGLSVSRPQATQYLKHPRFIDLLTAEHEGRGGSGIWAKMELQRFLTRVVAGIEPDGYEMVSKLVLILPFEDDYDQALGGDQWRKEYVRVETYPSMAERLKAADLLGRTMGAFMEKIEVTGDLKVSVSDLLDDDLRPAIDVTPEAHAEIGDGEAE
jgi:hypothetical protein